MPIAPSTLQPSSYATSAGPVIASSAPASQTTPLPVYAPRAAADTVVTPVALPTAARLAARRVTDLLAFRAPAHNAGDVCPITLVPVGEIARTYWAPDGYIYDRDALAEWFLTSDLSPVTREPMPQSSRALLGLTGLVRREARKAGTYLASPTGVLTSMVVGGVIVGGIIGPVGLAVHSRSTGTSVSPLLIALTIPVGAAIVGFTAFGVGLPLCQRLQRYQERARDIPMIPVGV